MRCATGRCGGSVGTTAGGRCPANPAPGGRPRLGPRLMTTSCAGTSPRAPEPAVARGHHRAPHRRGQALSVRHQGRVLEPDRQLVHGRADEGSPRGRRPRQRGRPPRRGRRLQPALGQGDPVPRPHAAAGPDPPPDGRLDGPGRLRRCSCNPTCWTDAAGTVTTSCASRSSPGSNAPTTDAAAKPPSAT
jgi:hypothetical protein